MLRVVTRFLLPPLASFFMKVLSFTLSDELLAAGESCPMAAPATLSAATVRVRIQNCETIVILVFMTLYG